MTVDFGLALVEKHPKSALSQWMDDLDLVVPKLEGHFKSLWMTDHLFWSDQYAYEVWTTLSFIAAKWPKFDVGPMVMGQNYRNPALLAKMAATLQVFSGGRFIMGIGAGWKEDEYRAYGYDYPSAGVRLEQLEDSLEIMKRLWTQPGQITYHGKHYRVENAYLEPKPVPVPPICIGVKGDKSLRIAAQYADWWNISDASLAFYQDRMSVLDRYCEEQGHDPKSIRRTWFGRLVTGRNDAEVNARANSRPGIVYSTNNAFVGTPSQVVEQLQAFVAAGNTYFMLDIVGLPNPDIVSIILEEIIPNVH
ncbi:MAG: LLM class flavin-dependent oxidoreductase [Anaerolineae bacterium]|nr:LLM class flavin-dependent oxidoreductase [Anaerolineae bacterium]